MAPVLLTGLLALHAALASVPQSPVAAGPLGGVLEVVSAADTCGIRQLRLDTRRDEALGPARLYIEGPMPADPAMSCLEAWLTQNGKRLGLMPRWWKDDFTKDKP